MKKINKNLIIVLFIFIIACRQEVNLKPDMTREEKDFLSYVRYIITRDERQAFLNIPPEKRKEFIEDFWERRNPYPGDDINMYKDIYFQRIEEANHLFNSEGKNGWLSDRGRTYVILGKPDRRDAYPQGITFYGPSIEIWYYDLFPVIFLDPQHMGIYKIDYPNSAAYIQIVNDTEMILHRSQPLNKALFDFNYSIKQDTKLKKIQVIIEIPFKMITFEEKNNTFHSSIDINLLVLNSYFEKQNEFSQSFPLAFKKEDLDRLGKNLKLEVIASIDRGQYHLRIKVKDRMNDLEKTKYCKIVIK